MPLTVFCVGHGHWRRILTWAAAFKELGHEIALSGLAAAGRSLPGYASEAIERGIMQRWQWKFSKAPIRRESRQG